MGSSSSSITHSAYFSLDGVGVWAYTKDNEPKHYFLYVREWEEKDVT